MGARRGATYVVMSVVAVAWFAGGVGACAKSRTGQKSEANSDDADGPSDERDDDFVSEPMEPFADPPDPPDPPRPARGDGDGAPVPMRDEPDNRPEPPPMRPVPPPPEVVHERGRGVAVLDIDPDAPTSWMVPIMCEKIRGCDSGGMELLTQEECVALFGGPCGTVPQVPQDLVSPDCVEAVEASSCDDLPLAAMTPACLESVARVMASFSGNTILRAEGETCDATNPCDTGLWCLDQNVNCGTCQPYAQIGDECDQAPCLGGYCDPATLLCVPYLRAGEACQSGARCLMGCRADGVCQGIATQGVPPLQFVGCEDDNGCAGNECRDGYCMPPAPLGAPCGSDGHCAFGRCHEGVCAVSATCDLPGEGEYCARMGRCQAPFACISGRCTWSGVDEPLAVGEPCRQSNHCESGYCNNGFGGQCSLRPAGFNCESDEQCQGGQCIHGLCGLGTTLGCGDDPDAG